MKPIRLIVSCVCLALVALVSVVTFASQGLTASNPTAIAQINGNGISGQLTMVESESGIVQVTLSLEGDPTVLLPGKHGVHLHESGTCEESKKFSSAKGHFDPGPLGSSTPVEKNHPYHLGDLPNVYVNAKGSGKLYTVTTRVTLSDSPVSLLDTDGTAVIIHKNTDLIKAGGSAEEAGGGRLACGVIQKA